MDFLSAKCELGLGIQTWCCAVATFCLLLALSRFKICPAAQRQGLLEGSYAAGVCVMINNCKSCLP